MTTTRRIRLGEQTQGDIVDLGTDETDATLVLAPDGAGGVEFRAESGGGSPSSCDHEHGRARFVAAGATPETFTVVGVPLWGVTVTVQGVEADPLDVTLSVSDVSLDTIAAQVVVIHYESECGSLGSPLIFPGTDETHDMGSTPTQMNVLGGFTTTGPAYAVIRGTDATDEFAIGTDDYPGLGFDIEGAFGPGYGNSPQAGDIYMFKLENAAAYWIGANFGTYSGGFTGSATYDLHYPDGGGTALTFPGTDIIVDGTHVNVLATINAVTPTALFVTLTAPLPAGYWFGVSNSAGWSWYYGPTSGWPPGNVDPIPAGTYAFLLDEDGSAPGNWYVFITDTVGYQGGLTGSGTYETHTP